MDSRNNAPESSIKKAVSFEEGSVIVHPAYGIGTVKSVETKDIGGSKIKLAEIFFTRDKLSVKINPDSDASLLRGLISEEEIPYLMEYLKEYSSDIPLKSSDRYNINTKKMKDVDIKMLVQVIKDLIMLSKSKKLTAKEQAMLKSAKKSLSSEFAFVSKMSETKAERLIEDTCRNL